MRTVIVVFGAASLPNGQPSEKLQERLRRAQLEAKRFPKAPIVVTGGAVKGPAEGPLMKRWLVQHNIAASRIVVEDQALYTLDNARRVAPLLAGLKATDIVLVTSASHMARSRALLRGEMRLIKRPLHIRPAAAREPGTREQVAARYRDEAIKTARDLATQAREGRVRLPRVAG